MCASQVIPLFCAPLEYWTVTLREGAYLLVIVALGLRLGRDMLALHRWQPDLFRGGPIILRTTRPLAVSPTSIPTPPLRTGWFFGAKYKVLSNSEVGFTAQSFNSPCLIGRLVVDSEAPSLTLLARPLWTAYAVFIVGFTFIGFPWQALLLAIGLMAVNYAWEVHEFRRLFRTVVEQIEHGLRA